MITSKVFQILVLLSLNFHPSAVTAQNSYEQRYFKFMDYLLTFPYDFLEKTPFEITSLKNPPSNASLDANYWSVSMLTADGEFYDSFAEIRTGFAPMHVLFSRKLKTSFVIRFYSSMNIDFDRMKEHLEKNGIVFGRTGTSQIFQDRLERGHCFIELSMENKSAVLSIYAVDPKSGKTKM